MQRLLRAMTSWMYWLAVAIVCAVALAALLAYVPIDPDNGSAQKILYIHLPAALNTFLGAGVIAVCGVEFLWSRRAKWDVLAAAAGRVTVVLCTIVLVTGMIWGHFAWDRWWTWSPSLSFSLVLWLLYVGYVALRHKVAPERRATVSAVYGVIAALDVPLVYLSVKLIPDIHPPSMDLTSPMRTTLIIWTVAGTMLTLGCIAKLVPASGVADAPDPDHATGELA